MGYTTTFEGQFDFDKPLDSETFEFLTRLAMTRRMKRNVGPEYGEEGEFFVAGEGKDFMGPGQDSTIINYNRPPSNQPSLWCGWIPAEDRLHLKWDGSEKFYGYVEWLKYIIEKITGPGGYLLNGKVNWKGEDSRDNGTIVITDNRVEAIEDSSPRVCEECGHFHVDEECQVLVDGEPCGCEENYYVF